MKLISIRDAVGHIICHDITRIVRGGEKGVAFRKGHVVRPEDIEPLLKLGKSTLYVWEKTPGMLHEDEAAEALYSMCAAPGIARSTTREGKIDLFAEYDGLFKLDAARLDAINQLGEMVIATRHNNYPVKKGDKLAGMRVIPLIIEKGKIDAALAAGAAAPGPLFRLLPYRQKLRAGVVVTGGEVYHGRIKDTFSEVVLAKLAAFGCEITSHTLVDDSTEMIVEAIRKNADADLIVCTGGMSVDPDDLTPGAIRAYGADIVSYGAPVLPGAMFLLAYKGNQAVMGLPSCVMHADTTVLDIVLPRVIAGDPVTREEIRRLWHGGLCLACPDCRFPACSFGKGS